MGSVYGQWGVRTRINGAGLITRLGGSLPPAEVLEAMAEASQAFVDMAELQAAASRVIASHTGAEAGLVTAGAAAGLTLGTAACLTGLDPARMGRLPETAGMPGEVLMPRTHRTAYDHAIRAAGARIQDVGTNDRATGAGVRDVEAWELEAAITAQTAAIAYTAGPGSQPPLDEVVAVAHRHALPVVVDAAAQLPPVANLRRFIDAGADLVAFSGGKALRGPQGTGILCGRKDLIAAAALQQLDMDARPETWQPPVGYLPQDWSRGLPQHGIGRGCKVSKEEVVGLLVALERFARLDHASEERRQVALLGRLAERLRTRPTLCCRLRSVEETGRIPLLEISWGAEPGRSAFAVSLALQAGDPPIHLSERRASDGILTVNPAGLREGEEEAIATRLLAVFAAHT